MVTSPSLVNALDAAGYRLTQPRRALAELIAAHDGHFTAADLVAEARARPTPVGRATVFRALELFTDLGLVERLDLPSGEHAYVPCAPAHHHHAICSRCGRTARVDDIGLDEQLRRIGARTGYRIESHRLELYGICPVCRLAEDAPA